MNKFKKDDQVIVIAGANKGKTGKVLSIKDQKVLVEGVNVRTIHKKPSGQEAGQILKVERPIHISNISHVEDGKAVKVKFVVKEGEGKNFTRKTRVSKKSGKTI